LKKDIEDNNNTTPGEQEKKTTVTPPKEEEKIIEGPIWMFGFGSNMDVENAVKVKKGVPVTEHVGAIAKGWRMAFNQAGIPCCEPFFANAVKGSETDEIHGVAYCTDYAGMKKMDE
jgi:hypothetical protein